MSWASRQTPSTLLGWGTSNQEKVLKPFPGSPVVPQTGSKTCRSLRSYCGVKERGSAGEFGPWRADVRYLQWGSQAPEHLPSPLTHGFPRSWLSVEISPVSAELSAAKRERVLGSPTKQSQGFLNTVGNCSLMVCVQGEAGGLAGNGRRERGKPQSQKSNLLVNMCWCV